MTAVQTVAEPGVARAIVPRANPSRDVGKAASPNAARVAMTRAVAVSATRHVESATKDVGSGTRGAVKVLTVKEVRVVGAARAADFNHGQVAVKRVLAANASGR